MPKFKIDDIIEYNGRIYQIDGITSGRDCDSFIYDVKCLKIMSTDDEALTGIGSCAEGLMKLVDFTDSTEKEKIKAYDIAVEKAKECLKDGTVTSTVIAVLHDIFPELSLSDDESIRKELINAIDLAYDCGISLTKENHEKYIDWLERQKIDPYDGVQFNCHGHRWCMCARDNGVDVSIDGVIAKHISTDEIEQIYTKTAMLDCHTCANYNVKCEPEKNKFICEYPQKKGQNILEEECQAPKVTTICGKDYICIKDYKEGNCEYSKGYVYHCERDGYLNDNYGNSWSCTAEWLDEYMREEKSYVAEKEKETFVSGHFLRYEGSDIYGLKSGENYWLEYVGNDTYIGRSDNILNQRFDITPKQLFTLFYEVTDNKESTVEDVNSKTETEEEANAPVGYGKYVDEKMFEATKRYYADNSDPNRYSLADVFYEGVRTGQHLFVLDAEARKKDLFNQTVMSIINWVDMNTLKVNESLSEMECEEIRKFVLNSDWGRLYDIIKDKLEHHTPNENITIEEHSPMTLVDYVSKPIFNVGDVMRTKDEARRGIVGGLPVVVSIDENYYLCTNELIPIKYQFEYEYPPMKGKPVANETAEDNVNEGDWLINSKGQPIKISRIYKDVYGADRCALTFTDGTRTDPLLELVIADENTRHWDIEKDAKDGDILVWDDSGDQYIFIFKCITDDHANAYCGLNVYLDKIETGEEENHYYNLSQIKPADKEERTMLETSLRNAGIKWNADDKTIVAVEPKFNVGDTIIKSRNSGINNFGQFTVTDITGGKYYCNGIIICDIVDQDEWEKISNDIAED